MSKVSDIFYIESAKSEAFEKYGIGDVAFITNGDYESSVLGYVTPFEKDKVFTKKSICFSSFGEVTIPSLPFLPRGNGGSGLVVLTPKKEMGDEELYSYASQLNLQKWRFSFSRMAISRRVKDIKLKKYIYKLSIKKEIKSLLPISKAQKKIAKYTSLKMEKLTDCCNIFKKTSLPQGQMEEGKTPYVTASSKNNGISGLVDEKPNFNSKCLTVALNGSVGETFFQFDDFITSGDNAILRLKEDYNPFLLLYIGVMIKNHQWRYNYYRKLNLTKLNKMTIPIPYNKGKVDLEYIEKVVKNSYGFKEIKRYL